MVADALSRLCLKMTFLKVRGLKIRNDEESFKWFNDVHNDLHGHSGASETQRRLMQSNRRWPGMHKDIKKYISLCPSCQKNRHNVNRNVAFSFTVSSYAP